MKTINVDHGKLDPVTLATVPVGAKWGDTGKHAIWIKLGESCESVDLITEEVRQFEAGRKVFRIALVHAG